MTSRRGVLPRVAELSCASIIVLVSLRPASRRSDRRPRPILASV
jgi:hypothetical protein